MKEVLVEQAMTPDPVTVTPGTSVTDVAKMMVEKNIGGLPVVTTDGDLVGIVTESDLIVQDSDVQFPSFVSFLSGYIFVPGSLRRFDEHFRKAVAATAGEVMTENVMTLDAGDSVEHAATLMSHKKMKRFPVLKDGSLVGILTMADVVRLISKDIPVEGTED
jgi:CBS domain-containing protein